MMIGRNRHGVSGDTRARSRDGDRVRRVERTWRQRHTLGQTTSMSPSRLASPQWMLSLQMTMHAIVQVESLYGSGGGYVRGLGYPSDAIINSQEYSASLLRVAVATGLCTALLGHRVVDIKDNGTEAVTILSDGARFTSRHVVVATGGLWFNNLPSLPLAPYIKPCWSYLVVMNGTSHQADVTRPPPPPQRDSPNLLTYCQTRDWAICRGVLRLSGEDNNSAQTQPHTAYVIPSPRSPITIV